MPAEIIEKELSYKIVQAAYQVYNTLGPGFTENIYEEAMVIVLNKDGQQLERQKPVDVYFQGQKIGRHVLDLVVNQRVIIELKAVAEIVQIHK